MKCPRSPSVCTCMRNWVFFQNAWVTIIRSEFTPQEIQFWVGVADEFMIRYE